MGSSLDSGNSILPPKFLGLFVALRRLPCARDQLNLLTLVMIYAAMISNADLLPLSQEIENAGRYLAIERNCVGEDLQVEVKVADGLENFLVPVFVLQLLVENAIRHGLEARPGAFLLEISAELDEEKRLRLEVINTGDWVEPRPVPTRTITGILVLPIAFESGEEACSLLLLVRLLDRFGTCAQQRGRSHQPARRPRRLISCQP